LFLEDVQKRITSQTDVPVNEHQGCFFLGFKHEVVNALTFKLFFDLLKEEIAVVLKAVQEQNDEN